MYDLSAIATALGTLFFPANLLAMLIGVVVGMVVGALPGMGGAMGVVILTPMIFGMEAAPALMMVVGVFCASRFGGAVGAILFNIPGTAASAATVLDGFPMMRKGESQRAIAVSCSASFLGGSISIITALLFTPFIAHFALKFGAGEYFLLAIFGMTIIASLSEGSMLKGMTSGFIGMFLSTIGTNPISGTLRFTFDQVYLYGGINILWAILGFFGFSEAFKLIAEKQTLSGGNLGSKWKLKILIQDTISKWRVWLYSTLLGTIIGAIPGTGGSVATWVCYNECRRISKNKHEWGTGIVDGIFATEAADNAAIGGEFIPTLALGVPGGGLMVIFLGVLIIVGIQPGPQIFSKHAVVTYGFLLSVFVCNIMSLVLCLMSIKILTMVTKVPARLLIATVIMMATIGSYSSEFHMEGVLVTFALGLLGYIMKATGYPVAPVVIAMILTPIAESNYNRALLITRGSHELLYRSTISKALIVFTVISIVSAFYYDYKVKRKKRADKGLNKSAS